MDSTNVYAYTSIIALLFCIPPAVMVSALIDEPFFFLLEVLSKFHIGYKMKNYRYRSEE